MSTKAVLGIVVIAGGVMIAGFAATNATRSEATTTAPDHSAAINPCKDAIRGRMLAPSAAQFTSSLVVNVGWNAISVSGYVTGANGFGVPVTAPYACTETAQYVVVNATVGDSP